MGVPSCRICIVNIFSILTGVCIYGTYLCISLRSCYRSGGSTISFLSYFITDPSYSLQETFKSIKEKKTDFVCYRNKTSPNEKEIIEFADFAKQYSKVFINFDSLIDEKLLNYFDGIHFPTRHINILPKFKKKFPNHILITSTHSFDEIKKAKISDFVTFSPIFDSKGRKGLGINTLNKACELHPDVIALGGIVSDKEIEKIKNSKAVGFASIRYFYK